MPFLKAEISIREINQHFGGRPTEVKPQGGHVMHLTINLTLKYSRNRIFPKLFVQYCTRSIVLTFYDQTIL